jgi:acetyl-CoA carboxylase carboxyltransferase component
VRERVARLTDEGSFVEDALLANWENEGFGADGVVTGMASIAGRPVCLMAKDPTVPRTSRTSARICPGGDAPCEGDACHALEGTD